MNDKPGRSIALQPLAYRPKDAAAVLGISQSTLYGMIAEGRIEARKLGGATLIRHEELVRVLDCAPVARAQKVAMESAAEKKERPLPAPTMPAPLKPKVMHQPRGSDAVAKTPSSDLAAIVGNEPLRRPDAMAKLWTYIREHGLQNKSDKRIIISDDRLKVLFGKNTFLMYEMNRLLLPHLSEGD